MTRQITNFTDYDYFAMRTAHHPTGSEKALLYVGIALAGEAGEVANEIKKVSRDDKGILSEERRNKIIAEIGDCLWYLNSMANEIGTTLMYCANQNIDKLEKRHGIVDSQTGYSPVPEHSVVPALSDGFHL